MSEDLVQNLKRAGEQVLGAKGLTGNDHVRLSALLKVAALEIEALCVARDDAAELRALLNHPLLNKLMGELEDSSTGRWWGMAEEWMDLRDAALTASEEES